MRPINLIPAEERRHTRGAGSRSGPLPYLLVGALVLLLAGVLMLLHYSNQVSDRESNVARLEVERTEATALATKLAPFTSFAQVTEQRTATIGELANDRFDWARVIQQLSLILPPDVYFTNMSGSAGGNGGEGEGSGVAGPSLNLQGCAVSQTAVAGFVSTLKQIDGVTRVSLENSTVGEGENAEAVSGASPCSTGGKATFAILVAFDSAPPSPDGSVTVEEVAPESEPEGESSSSEGESSSEESSTEPEGGAGESAPSQSATTGEGGATG